MTYDTFIGSAVRHDPQTDMISLDEMLTEMAPVHTDDLFHDLAPHHHHFRLLGAVGQIEVAFPHPAFDVALAEAEALHHGKAERPGVPEDGLRLFETASGSATGFHARQYSRSQFRDI